MKCLLSKINQNEFYRYLITGVSVALINLVVYSGLQKINIAYATANLFAIIISKAFGYFMNKLFVYRSYTVSWADTFREMLRFILARGFTGVVDFFGVIVLVESIGLDKFYAKLILIIVVIILNYVLGKKAVFNK